MSVVRAVKAAPLDAKVIDFEMNAALLSVARLARWRALWAGRIAAPVAIIGKLEAMLAAKVEGAPHEEPPVARG
jgi:hypothetical protein